MDQNKDKLLPNGHTKRMDPGKKLIEQEINENRLRLALNKIDKSRIASLNLMEDLRDEIEFRKKTENELRASESKLRSLFTTMQEGFALHEIICDKTGRPIDYRFLEINPAFEKLTGLKAQDIIGKTSMEVLPESEPFWIEKYGQVALTGNQIIFENFSHVLNKYYSVSASSPEYGKFTTIFIDITERKTSEEAVMLEKENFRHSLEDSPLGVRIVSNNGKTLYANKTILDIYGYESLRELQDTPLISRYTPESYNEAQRRKQSRKKNDLSPKNYEVSIVRKNGEIRHLKVNRKKVLWDSVLQFLVIYEDITEVKTREIELKKSHEELVQLNLYLQRVREEERKLIARELHDELGQSLTAVKIDLGTLKMDIDDKKSLKSKIEQISNLVSDSIGTVKRLTSELRPLMLDDLGLITAIEWYTAEFEARTGVKTQLFLEKDIALKKDHELVIFRIIQESLTNIARHSKAHNAIIHFSKKKRNVILEIRDDGIGFKESTQKFSKSFGLLNMIERAKELGGNLVIESEPNKGTIVRLSVKIES